MCVGLHIKESTGLLVALQGVLSFPVINCTDLPGTEMFDGAQIIKSSVSLLEALVKGLVDGACC